MIYEINFRQITATRKNYSGQLQSNLSSTSSKCYDVGMEFNSCSSFHHALAKGSMII